MESKPVPISLRLLYLTLGFALGAAVVAASWLNPRRTTPPTVRNVTVDYKYETSSDTVVGNRAMPVDSIQFHPGYVVILDTGGDSRLFAVDRLREFSFRPVTGQSPK